eukprot:g24584.t1
MVEELIRYFAPVCSQWKTLVAYHNFKKVGEREFFEEVMTKLDKGELLDVIYLDFQKAFEKVPQRRLLNKGRAHGVRDKILAWTEDWLTCKRHR